jgi:hypothetical protein
MLKYVLAMQNLIAVLYKWNKAVKVITTGTLLSLEYC